MEVSILCLLAVTTCFVSIQETYSPSQGNTISTLELGPIIKFRSEGFRISASEIRYASPLVAVISLQVVMMRSSLTFLHGFHECLARAASESYHKRTLGLGLHSLLETHSCCPLKKCVLS